MVKNKYLADVVAGITMMASSAFAADTTKNVQLAATNSATSVTQQASRPLITLHVGDEFNQRRVSSIVRGVSRDNIPVDVVNGGFEPAVCMGMFANGVLVSTFDEGTASVALRSVAQKVYDGHGVNRGLREGPCAVTNDGN